ncbi:MAG TPA: O-antigen ligase domain-containing protein [Anaerolineae bacterium]|nr:O-antigen ligase domain-containing protein [Anaerolineae bacterium]
MRLRFAATVNLALLLLTLGFGPIFQRATGATLLSLRFIDLLLPLFALLMGLIWLRERQLPDLKTPLFILLFLFALWTLTSLFVSQHFLLTVRRIGRIWLLLIMVAGIQTLQLPLKQIAQLLALHLLGQSALAIAQFQRQASVGLHWLGEAQLGENVLRMGDQFVMRAQGFTEHPNLLAIVLLTSLFVLLAGISAETPLQSLLFLSVLLLGSSAFFFTFSRAATLGGLLALLFLLGQHITTPQGLFKQRRLLPVALIILMPVLLLGYFYRDIWLSRLTISSTLEFTSIQERVIHNQVALAMLQEYPLFGVGARNGQFLFSNYFVVEAPISQVIHSTVMLISAELGFIGGLLWLAILLYPPLYTIRQRKYLTPTQHILTAALLPYLIVDWTSPAAWDTPTGSLLRWLLLALWIQHVEKSRVLRRK